VKTISNKTHDPIRVPLPRGKVLHLGPLKEAKISHNDIDHEPLQRLVEAGSLEIKDDKGSGHGARGQAPGAHAETHGHHPGTGHQAKGDR